MTYRALLGHAFHAFKRNLNLILFLSIPLLISLPLAFFLPNFVSLSGIFLRFSSVGLDLSFLDALFFIVLVLVSLVLFSFAIAAINVVIKSQRRLVKLNGEDLADIETGTFKLFYIYLLAFTVIFAVNLLLFEHNVQGIAFIGARSIGMLFALIVSLIVLFAPQAVTIDDLSVSQALDRSITTIFRHFNFFVFFLLFAGVLLIANTVLFLELGKAIPFARHLSLVTNALIILPFLEALKTEIYLSKYKLL
ncbi:hypothetical protein HUU53_04840 [Candidatus Micrarchaeota archaeon]|nr:hypothetical protein [Candidatus Micrarchaeota archaeon]